MITKVEQKNNQKVSYYYSKRRVARFSAIQIAYSFNVCDGLVGKSFVESCTAVSNYFSFDSVDLEFVISLVDLLGSSYDKLDYVISSFLDGSWTIDRLNLVVLSILRIALAELLVLDTPSYVVVSEYVDITSSAVGSVEANFVNAILDKIHKSKSWKDNFFEQTSI